MKAGNVRVGVLAGVVVVVGLSLMVLARIRSHRGGPRSLTLYGNVDIRQVELAFRVPGRVLKMNFDEGQEPAAGAVLAELDPQTYEEEIRSSEAQVSQQEDMIGHDEPNRAVTDLGEGGLRRRHSDRFVAALSGEQSFPKRSLESLSSYYQNEFPNDLVELNGIEPSAS